jgi:hypothetical protein
MTVSKALYNAFAIAVPDGKLERRGEGYFFSGRRNGSGGATGFFACFGFFFSRLLRS